MKRILSRRRLNLVCLLMAVALVTYGVFSDADEPAQPKLVFLLIGQSNMAGRAALEPGDDKPMAGVFLLDDRGRWEPAKNPLNRYSSDRKTIKMQRIGPGDGFARRLHKELPRTKIGLIVNARGGTSVEQWAKGQPLYEHTLKRLRALPKLKLSAVLWHQGEANAKGSATTPNTGKSIAAKLAATAPGRPWAPWAPRTPGIFRIRAFAPVFPG